MFLGSGNGNYRARSILSAASPPVRTACSWRTLLRQLKSILILIPILAAAGALDAQTVTVNPSSLTFSAVAGGAAQSQTVSVSPSGTYFAVSNQPWLKVCTGASCTGANSVQISNSLTVIADPTGQSVGSYSGSISIIDSSVHQVGNIPVSFTVASIGVNPSSVSFTYQIGTSPSPVSQQLTLTSAASTTYTVSLSGTDCTWLQQPANGTSPGTMTVALNTAALPSAAGTHTCTIQIAPPSGPPVPVAVTLTVAAAPTVTAAPPSVGLFYQLGSSSSTNSGSQVLTLTNPGAVALPFQIQALYPATAANFLAITPSAQGTIPANGSTQVTVAYTPASNLAASATPYTATLLVFASGAANNPLQIPVSLTISSSPLLNISTAPVKFTYELNGPIPNAQTITATTTNAEANAPSSQQMTLFLTPAYTSGGAWFTVPPSAVTGTPFSISLNPSVVAGLSTGTYTGTISVIGNGSQNAPDAAHAIQIPVSLTVSNDPLIVASFANCSMSANNGCPMNFPYQTGQNNPVSQQVTIASSTGAAFSSVTAAGAMTAATGCTSNWLTVSPVSAGASNTSVFTVAVSPAGIPNGTVCTGTVTVNATAASGNASPNSPLQFTVKLFVNNSAMLVVNPISLSFNAAANSGLSTAQALTVTSTDASANGTISFTAASSAPWLVVNNFPQNTPNSLPVEVYPALANLAPGTYTAQITLTATGALDSGIVVPVTLQVTGTNMTVTPKSLTFNQTLGAAIPAAQAITVATDSTPITFTATATMTNGTGWLAVTQPAGPATNGSPATVQVSVNGSSLAAGTYTGFVTIAASAASGVNAPSTVSVPVTFVVAPGTLGVSPASLTFTATQGGAAQTKPISVSGTPSALNFTVAVSTGVGGNWLSVDTSSGTTPGTVNVKADPTGLQPGTYTGTVTVTSAGATGSPQTVNVTLNVVQAQTFTATPSTLDFNYVIGTQTTLQAKTVALTSSGGTANFTATVSSSATWLVVSPTSGTTPATLTVSIQPAGLAAGNYTGTINITSPSSATTTAATITVNLTVAAVPTPVITAIQNAASAIAGPVVPGENIVLYGTGIGPATLTMGTVTNNKLATTAGQTQVLFDGVPAPIYYASATQTSVFVPYGIAGRTSTQIVISYQGVTSAPISQTIAAVGPGVYTANASGSGPAVAWDYDLSGKYAGINSASNPAVKGGVVSLYVTGEGVTNAPAGIDGMLVTNIYNPVAPVTATVGGVPATVQFAGSAPGSIYGVMQVNVQIPATAPSGAAVPVVINVGGTNSQQNVTLSIQ